MANVTRRSSSQQPHPPHTYTPQHIDRSGHSVDRPPRVAAAPPRSSLRRAAETGAAFASMTVTVRKAGEKLVGKTVLRPPRAVTRAEAQARSVEEPTRLDGKAATTSMMPWKGWVSRLLRDTLGAERYERLRATVFFMPDDIYDLTPAPMISKKIRITKPEFPEVTAQYRYPSPGSQAPVHVPEFEAGEDPYDTGYFKKDTRRRYVSFEELPVAPEVARLQVELMPQATPEDREAAEQVRQALAAGPQSSPGNRGVFATGPSNFDPTGLRATMSVNWKSLNESLDANMPDHLPTPVWVGQEDQIVQWHRDRDLPVPIGGYYAPLKVPVKRRVARW